MPWSTSNLPPAAKSLKGQDAKLFVSVANSVLKQTGDDGKAVKAGLAAVNKTKGNMATKKVDKSLDIKINDQEVIDPGLLSSIINSIACFFRDKQWNDQYQQETAEYAEEQLEGAGMKDPNEAAEGEYTAPVVKALNSELRQATYVVLEPNKADLQKDIYDTVEVSKACHNFWTFCQKAYVDHSSETDSAKIVENYIAPADIVLGDKLVTKGTWLQVWQFDNTLWESVKDGTYTGVSIGAYATSEKI